MFSMPNRLVITEPGAGVVGLQGEIDAHSAPALAARFDTLPAGTDDIVFDMAEVTFADSSGLRVLLDVHQRATEASRQLILLRPSDPVIKLLEASGLSDHFTIRG
jgi:anti-sigma B factor antagonist